MKHVTKFNEQQHAQFTYNVKLNDNFWENDDFDKKIGEKLITIAKNFYDTLNYDLEIIDIILTGSLANFNYNKFSDLDVHILIDFSKLNKDIDLVKRALDGYRFMWNIKHNIKIKEHEVELYLQDINESHTSTGVYSILFDKWLTKPIYNKPSINQDSVIFKYSTIVAGIDRLEKLSNTKMNNKLAKKYYDFVSIFKDKVLKSRKLALEKDGEFSEENLVFKKLRNSGHIEKLINTINIFYDKIYTQ